MRNIIKQTMLVLAVGLSVTLLTLLLVEWSLHLGGYGHSRRLFVRASGAEASLYHINPLFYAQFFPPENEDDMMGLPYWGYAVPRQKLPNHYRVVVLGGSVALGHLPDEAFNMSRVLESMLQASFPELEFEVYNLACFALNSHVMRRVAREAAVLSPDLFVVYMGNNEYIGPFGPSRAASNPPPSSAHIQRLISLQQLRLVRMLSGASPPEAYSMPQSPLAFYQQALKQRPEAPGRTAMYANFADNLHAICSTALRANAAVVLSTLGNNIQHWPPYAFENQPGLSPDRQQEWQHLYESGLALQQKLFEPGRQSPGEALALYEAAAELDDSHGGLQFRLGQCYWLMEEYGRARDAFTRARDFDCFPIRADSQVNARIRDTVAAYAGEQVFLADAEQSFIESSENGIMGDHLFFDAMHLLFEGNHIIASTVFEAVKEVIAGRAGIAPPQAAPSLEACRERLGMSPYLDVRHLRLAVNHLERYVGALYDPRDVNLGSLHRRLALKEYHLPDSAFEDALAALENALRYRERDFYIRRAMTELLLEGNRIEEAAEQARLILELFPERLDARMVYDRLTAMISG